MTHTELVNKDSEMIWRENFLR